MRYPLLLLCFVPLAACGSATVTNFDDGGVMDGDNLRGDGQGGDTNSGDNSPGDGQGGDTDGGDSLPPAESCYVVEVCGNNLDDDCNGAIDESGCVVGDDYLASWKNIGEVVDYVVFGTYPLYLETQAGRDLQRLSWGTRCAGQHGTPADPEETYYCLGGDTDYLEWNMTVPESGYYVLMLGNVHSTATNHELQVERGAGFVALPNVLGAESVGLLMHSIGGYPSSIFYLVRLEQGSQRFRISGGTGFFDITSAVLAHLLRYQHFYPDPVYPHLHFNQQQLDTIAASPSAHQQAIIDAITTQANDYANIVDLPALGERNRDGVVAALAYSGLLSGNQAHMAKAVELYLQVLEWVAANDGDYRALDILEYGYDMRRLGVGFDLTRNAMTPTQRAHAKDLLRVEMMRHALSNISGQWWRLPRAGGWTSSHAQGGQAGMALYFDDKVAKFSVDISVLMYATALRDNITIDGVHLQALGPYYGWDFWNLAYFQNALRNNPGIQATNLFEYDNRAMQSYYRWLIYSLAPTKRCMGPFGTSNCGNDFYASMASTLLLAADYYGDGSIKWLYDNTVGDGAQAAVVGAPLPEALAWVDTDVAAADPAGALPLGRALREHEHVYMRTGWQQDDIAYMTRCGLSANHDQAEHGSIILYADGLNYVQTYNGYDASEPTESTTAKNYVLIDGRGQTRAHAMTTRMGRVPTFLHSGSADYQLCDNSYAYNVNPSDPDSQPVEYSERRVVFVRPDSSAGGYFVVLDRIKADDNDTHDYQFALHTGCQMQWWGVSDGSCENPLNIAVDAGLGATVEDFEASSNLNLKVRFVDPPPADMAFERVPMPVVGYPDSLRASRSSPSLAGEFMAILFPEDPGAGRVLPGLTPLALGAGQAGVLLGTDTIVFSKDGSAIDASGLQSDARVIIVRDVAAPTLAAMFEGRGVAIGGLTYLDASSQTNAVLRLLPTGAELTVGNEMTDASVDVTVGGLTASTTYARATNGEADGTVTTNSQGQVALVGLGPGKAVISLTAQ